MFLRAAFLLIVSLAVLLSYEPLYQSRYRGKPIPIALGLVLVLFALAFRVAAFAVGALSLSWFAPAFRTPSIGRLALLLGGVLGMWLGSIGLQMLQNLVLIRMGLPRRKLRWINGV